MSEERAVRGYRKALAIIDDYWGREAARNPEHVHCRKGCTLCCRGTFALSLADAALVGRAFLQLPADVRAEIGGRARQVLVKADIDPEVPASALSEEELDARVARVAGEPCPFLGADGACRIYADRPLVCRLCGLPMRSAEGEVLDPGCEVNFVGVDFARLDGYVLDVPDFDDAEVVAVMDIAAMRGNDPETELLLPAAVLAPWLPPEGAA